MSEWVKATEQLPAGSPLDCFGRERGDGGMSQTVLILPCEVGTTVYWNSRACVFTCIVKGFYFDGEELRYVLSRDGKDFYKPIASTKIFFSQSEAEAQLSAEYREEEK